MLPIPQDVLAQFIAILKQRKVPERIHADYRKWLRYFLDFRSKYHPPDSKSDQVRLFVEKLQKKNQTPEQQKQAAHALSLFFSRRMTGLRLSLHPKKPPKIICKHCHRLLFRFHRAAADIMNGDVWRNPARLNGTSSLTLSRQRSKRDIIPERLSRPMRIGCEDFSAF